MQTTLQPIPFRYPGGKFYAIKFLRKFWAAVDHSEYREPFAGGATIFFNKEKSKSNWLNDIDSELITTYQVMKSKRDRSELISRLSDEIASKERWREIKDYTPSSKVDIAFKYYYLNRTSFSGKLSSAAWGYRPKRSVPPERWHEKLEPCGRRLEGVKITCGDFGKVITAAPRGSSTESVFLYLDPPYYSPPKQKHYRSGFDLEDHARLASLLKNTDYKFFLTYDDVPEVRDLYSWAHIHDIEFIYRVENSRYKGGQRRNGVELVITNYELQEQPLLF
jgi:DNA adenine methylase